MDRNRQKDVACSRHDFSFCPLYAVHLLLHPAYLGQQTLGLGATSTPYSSRFLRMCEDGSQKKASHEMVTRTPLLSGLVMGTNLSWSYSTSSTDVSYSFMRGNTLNVKAVTARNNSLCARLRHQSFCQHHVAQHTYTHTHTQSGQRVDYKLTSFRDTPGCPAKTTRGTSPALSCGSHRPPPTARE